MNRAYSSQLIKIFLPLFLISFSIQDSFCQISIIGTATPAGEYSTDFNLVQDINTPSIWTGQLLLKKDSTFKFRANNDWAINWGADNFPSGPLFTGGANIIVDSTAIYQMTFDSSVLALTYAFVIVDTATIQPKITVTQNGQVGVGTIAPSQSAKFEMKSTSQGLLPPRMTVEERDQIYNPEAGLLLWCSDCGDLGEVQVYNGIKWTNFVGGFASLPTNSYPSFQEGMDINGEFGDDKSGYSVSFSADGSRLAIGAPFNNRGHVRVFDWNGITWAQIGADIDGVFPDSRFGNSVSLSADGSRLAVGAPTSNINGASESGLVRIFDWDGNSWAQLGATISGDAAFDYHGFSLSLSADGTRLAIGALLNNGNGTDSGQVRIYEWNGSQWIQLGGDIEGESSHDRSGRSISLSADGTMVAIGAALNDGNGNNSGHVRVYDWDGSTWVQVGSDIDGEESGDQSGWAISLSANGTRVAIGAPVNDGSGSTQGHVRVYDWNGSNWIQVGGDIDGETSGDESGYSVSLSADGNRLAISSRRNDENGTDSGHVRLYQWDVNEWVQLGSDLDGEAAGDLSGWSVSLSSDGMRLAIGAPENDGNGFGSGHVRVYK